MRKQSVLKAGLKSAIERVLKVRALNVFADENNNQQQQVNIEELIAMARKEEKDKLYPQIESLKSEKARITGSLNEALLKNAELTKQLDTLKNESGNVAELNSTIKDLEAKVEVLTSEKDDLAEKLKNAPKAEELEAKFKTQYEVKDYLRTALAEHKDDILKTFIGEVKGETKEEVDASIQKAIERTNQVREDLGVSAKSNKKKKDDGKVETPKPERPKRLAPPEHYGKLEEYDPEYIRNLDPNSAEYKEFRKQVLGLK